MLVTSTAAAYIRLDLQPPYDENEDNDGESYRKEKQMSTVDEARKEWMIVKVASLLFINSKFSFSAYYSRPSSVHRYNLYKYHSAQRVCSSKWPILGMVPIDLTLVSPAPRGWDFLVSDISGASGYSGISHELAKGLRMDVKVHLTAGTIVEKAPLELNILVTLWHAIGE